MLVYVYFYENRSWKNVVNVNVKVNEAGGR